MYALPIYIHAYMPLSFYPHQSRVSETNVWKLAQVIMNLSFHGPSSRLTNLGNVCTILAVTYPASVSAYCSAIL
jgi:hypothetical protein